MRYCCVYSPLSQWESTTADQGKIDGDRINALKSQSIPDRERLSLIYLPNQDHWTVQLPTEDTEQNLSPVEL